MCVECEDMGSKVFCNDCKDHYCALCFSWQHRTGNRSKHSFTKIGGAEATGGTTEFFMELQPKEEVVKVVPTAAVASSDGSQHLEELDRGEPLTDRARFIPMRITKEERVLLHLLEGALDVSEYTDKVDVTGSFGFGWSGRKSKVTVIREELDDMFSLLSGLAVCDNLKQGALVISDKSFKDNQEFYQHVFEVGRRYKIMNPQKMRSTYGKMMWMLQDMAGPAQLDWSCRVPITTVHSVLAASNSLALLEDPRLPVATREIVTFGKAKEIVEAEVAAKRQATAAIKAEYITPELPEEQLERVLVSVSDANSFLASNRVPVDRMIANLTTYFHPDKKEEGHSLSIKYGYGGSKLSHDHTTQFTFVLQSLVLWREIMHDMYMLWMCTEEDLLSEKNRYQLWNTGQGLNRVQSAPHVGNAMHRILSKVQREVRGWVGLSVVHLGDRDVPNAFVFIDKYLQVPRILGPISNVIDALPGLYEQEGMATLIDEGFGGLDKLRKDILGDYFRHGFDGSGSDGGSCIDGRLTSSWNWCALLEKKSYYPIFLLAGFQGFDGDFRR